MKKTLEMKYQKIPTANLGTVAYYLLQITQGVFKWNGELFFCPFVNIENKRYPFRVSTWTSEAVTGKDKKYSLPFIDDDILFLFADPLHPSTYVRTKQRSMDKSLGIEVNTIVLKKANSLIVKTSSTVHTLEFVRTLSDFERRKIFDPQDSREHELRHNIWKTSKKDGSSFLWTMHRDEWLFKYEEYQKDKTIPSRHSGRVKQLLESTGDW